MNHDPRVEIVGTTALRVKTDSARQLAELIGAEAKLESDSQVLIRFSLLNANRLALAGFDPPTPFRLFYKWAVTPFAHQPRTAEFMTAHLRCGVWNEQGTGKTFCAAAAADYLHARQVVRRVLVLSPVSVMYSAWQTDFASIAPHLNVGVAYGPPKKRKAVIASGCEVVVMNFDGLLSTWKEIAEDGTFDMIFIDECFVAGTMVDTPGGRRAIETLRAGDTVLTSSGPARIKTTKKRPASGLVAVETSDGNRIVCTPEHPFFTDLGWVAAANLASRRLFTGADLRYVRRRVQGPLEPLDVPSNEGVAIGADLLAILRTEEIPCAESWSESLFETDAGSARLAAGNDSLRRVPGGHVCGAQGAGVSTGGPPGQWDGHDRRGSSVSSVSPFRLDMELPGSVGPEAARLSHELQARFCVAGASAGPGSRRELTQHTGEKRTGPEERSQAIGTWVVSTAPVEQGRGTPVYNLEIDGTPNFFANGFLVHNCNAYKNSTTLRFKTLAKIIKPNTRVVLLTGTPASQSPVDAFGLSRIIGNPDCPKYVTAWRDRVMVQQSRFKWTPREGAAEMASEILRPSIRFTKAQCLDLPERLYVTRRVDLSEEQAKLYALLKKEMLVSLGGGEITAQNAGAMLSKLMQISSGAVYDSERQGRVLDYTPRYAALREIIEGTDRKVIVFANFRPVIGELVRKLNEEGIAAESIAGDTSAEARRGLFFRFQNTDTLKVLVVQPQAAAHGVTLTAADTTVWWGPPSSVELYKQGNDRFHRIGQGHRCTVFHLTGSVAEDKVFTSLMKNLSVHESIVSLFTDIARS